MGRTRYASGIRRRNARGFTLLELMVAIALAAFVVGLAPAALDRARDSLSYRATARELLSELREARSRAIRSGVPVAFFLHVASRSYGIDGEKRGLIPDELAVRVVSAANLASPDGRKRIVFQSDGGSSGGSVEIVRKSGQGVRLRVDWLLGRITQEAPKPS